MDTRLIGQETSTASLFDTLGKRLEAIDSQITDSDTGPTPITFISSEMTPLDVLRKLFYPSQGDPSGETISRALNSSDANPASKPFRRAIARAICEDTNFLSKISEALVYRGGPDEVRKFLESQASSRLPPLPSIHEPGELQEAIERGYKEMESQEQRNFVNQLAAFMVKNDILRSAVVDFLNEDMQLLFAILMDAKLIKV